MCEWDRLVPTMTRAFAALLVLPALAFAQDKEDHAIGTWRFLPELSTYVSAPAPKESIREWRKAGDGKVTFLHNGTSAAGKPFHTEFTAAYDGKPYPFKGGTLYNSVALTWKSPDKVEQVFRKDDKVTVRATRTISKDGRRMFIDSQGSMPDGRKFQNLLYYERQ